jgi:hypothetical protein
MGFVCFRLLQPPGEPFRREWQSGRVAQPPDFLNHFLQWVPRSSRSLRRAGTMPMVPRDFRFVESKKTREKKLVGERGLEPPTPGPEPDSRNWEFYWVL